MSVRALEPASHTPEATARALQDTRGPGKEEPRTAHRERSPLAQFEKSLRRGEDPARPKINEQSYKEETWA